MPSHQRPDEWEIEQGIDSAKLPVLDQTLQEDSSNAGEDRDESKGSTETDGSVVVPVQDATFREEREGWKGYVEWEAYPAKKSQAHKILASQTFPPPPEFQLGPIPNTNPVLEGVRWKLWHKALGGAVAPIPGHSWQCVVREKHPEMLHLLQFPYNGEPPKRLVTEKPVTPNTLHFVRNHGGIPIIDGNKWSLELDGLVANPQSFTLQDLQDESQFPRVEKLVTIQCSGTRRIEQIDLYAGEGDEMINAPWAEGAIGTARYVGVSLKKVIKACGGLKPGAKHLELFGADTYFKQNEVMNYSVSVPWSKVKANEVMLAWEMNGEQLPNIHGYPIRVVVMGYIGARSAKWVYHIRALERPTQAPVQSKEYLYFNQQVGKYNQHITDGIQIQEMPVSSAIMSPLAKQVVVHLGKIHVKGWAYSGGGRWPERVELSADGGFNWYAVPLANMSSKHKWSWRTWQFDLPCDVEGWVEVVCRCWDNSLNTQPLQVRSAWNWGLHVTSSAHRVALYSVNKSREATRRRLDQFEQRRELLGPITKPVSFPMSWDEYEDFRDHNEPRDVDD